MRVKPDSPWPGRGNAPRRKRLGCRAMQYLAFTRKHRSVTRTVPRERGIVPGYGAACVRARCRQAVRRSVDVFPDCDFACAARDHATFARSDGPQASDDRAAFAAGVEACRCRSDRIVQQRPWILASLDLICDKHRGRCAVAMGTYSRWPRRPNSVELGGAVPQRAVT